MLTPQEEKALLFITEYIVETGKSPSQIIIAKKMGLSRQRVGVLVKALKKKLKITNKPFVPYSIRLN